MVFGSISKNEWGGFDFFEKMAFSKNDFCISLFSCKSNDQNYRILRGINSPRKCQVRKNGKSAQSVKHPGQKCIQMGNIWVKFDQNSDYPNDKPVERAEKMLQTDTIKT